MGTLFRVINELISVLVFILEADKDKHILETHITNSCLSFYYLVYLLQLFCKHLNHVRHI